MDTEGQWSNNGCGKTPVCPLTTKASVHLITVSVQHVNSRRTPLRTHPRPVLTGLFHIRLKAMANAHAQRRLLVGAGGWQGKNYRRCAVARGFFQVR